MNCTQTRETKPLYQCFSVLHMHVKHPGFPFTCRFWFGGFEVEPEIPLSIETSHVVSVFLAHRPHSEYKVLVEFGFCCCDHKRGSCCLTLPRKGQGMSMRPVKTPVLPFPSPLSLFFLFLPHFSPKQMSRKRGSFPYHTDNLFYPERMGHDWLAQVSHQ